MKIVTLRSDIVGLKVDDIDPVNRIAVCREPPGQNIEISYPSDDEIQTVIDNYVYVSVLGSDTAASIDTSSAYNLQLKRSAAGVTETFAITTHGAGTAKTAIVSELNTAFASASATFVARLDASNRVIISSTIIGSNSYIQVITGGANDIAGALGLSGTVTSTTVSDIRTNIVLGVSPWADISITNIASIGTHDLMLDSDFSPFYYDLVQVLGGVIVESAEALTSFTSGKLHVLNDTSFTWNGTAGIAIACLEDDGSTQFTV